MKRLPALAALIGGVLLVLAGAWAMAAPRSFYEKVATYPPYNQHLYHDIGAFLVGLGAASLAGLKARQAITVGLVANAVAAVLHAVSHVVDRDLGGRSSDPWLFVAVAVVSVVVAAIAVKDEQP